MSTNSKSYNKKNYKKFWWKPEQIEDRSERNKARRKMEKAGRVKKGDWKEVDHKKWVKAWNGKKNLRVISQKKNRQLGAAKATRAKKTKKTDLYYV